jgi:hypothetical protein
MKYVTSYLALAGLVLILPKPSYGDDNTLKFRGGLAWYTYATAQQPETNSPLNPDNKILGLETKSATLDFRPNLRLDSGQFQLIGRPQFKTTASRHKVATEEPVEHPSSTSTWLEAYGVMNASDRVIISYGLQNYQWGAAESLNPSNRIFHENLDSKGLLAPSRGRHIARVNLTWTKFFTTVLMSETSENEDLAPFRAEETFQSRALMKHEVNWNSGSDYLGLVYGAPELGSPWIGEYFNITLLDGLALYGDASQQRNSEAWYPVIESSGVPGQQIIRMKQSRAHDGKVYQLAVGGLRYSFEGGSDLRFEYLANSAGWNIDDNVNAKAALDTKSQIQLPDYKTNLRRVARPGLEYRGQRYGMVSLRVPDALTFKDLTLYGRYMRSLQDYSTSVYGSVEYGFGSASTLLISGVGTRGAPESDLRGVIASSYSAGLRQDF